MKAFDKSPVSDDTTTNWASFIIHFDCSSFNPSDKKTYILELSTSLNQYTHLEKTAHAHPRNFESEFPHVLRWCSDGLHWRNGCWMLVSLCERVWKNLWSAKWARWPCWARKLETYLDGVEWLMVVVVPPSSVLLNKEVLAEGAECLSTYFSFFRAQVKLVVISDKWKTDEEFLDDIALKMK